MRITQALRKPANWQDFESLCLMLWREEWKSDDLKKNGRVGQEQNGVDISGHRVDENEYSAIQCKCKSEGESLKREEILKEIENAKSYRPPLKRYVIATTAKKDAAIEEFVRIKDVENRKAGLFSIDLKSWEDIVDMLERHKPVLNNYLDLITEDFSVSVMFSNEKKSIEIRPLFCEIKYVTPVAIKDSKSVTSKMSINGFAEDRSFSIIPGFPTTRFNEINRSYVPLKIVIHNEGTSPIDNFKLILKFDCPEVQFTYDNVEEKGPIVVNRAFMASVNSNIEFDGTQVIMKGVTLNPFDHAVSDDFFIKVPYGVSRVDIKWQLLSRHYNDSGNLAITTAPSMVHLERVDTQRLGETVIEDYVEVE